MSTPDSSHLPGPIRISEVEWIIMRNNPRFPKALIRRMDPGGRFEHFRVVTFDLDPSKRLLVGRFRSLEAANGSVLFDNSQSTGPGLPPNMIRPRSQAGRPNSTSKATHAISSETRWER